MDEREQPGRSLVRDDREKILARKVKVRITQGRTPPRAVVDPKWLSRVLRLLLLNAIQWSPSGGSVGIRIRREGEGLGITVSDEGPGIPASDHERVFDRFKQLGDTNTEKPAGIGLGLPLARAIVTRMGSTISLESDPGQGTRVTVTVPTTAKAAGVEEGIPRDALTS